MLLAVLTQLQIDVMCEIPVIRGFLPCISCPIISHWISRCFLSWAPPVCASLSYLIWSENRHLLRIRYKSICEIILFDRDVSLVETGTLAKSYTFDKFFDFIALFTCSTLWTLSGFVIRKQTRIPDDIDSVTVLDGLLIVSLCNFDVDVVNSLCYVELALALAVGWPHRNIWFLLGLLSSAFKINTILLIMEGTVLSTRKRICSVHVFTKRASHFWFGALLPRYDVAISV